MQINSIAAITPITPRTSVPARPGSSSSFLPAVSSSSTGRSCDAVQATASADDGGGSQNGAGSEHPAADTYTASIDAESDPGNIGNVEEAAADCKASAGLISTRENLSPLINLLA